MAEIEVPEERKRGLEHFRLFYQDHVYVTSVSTQFGVSVNCVVVFYIFFKMIVFFIFKSRLLGVACEINKLQKNQKKLSSIINLACVKGRKGAPLDIQNDPRL